MKKIFISIVVILALVVIADKVYRWYSRTHINTHESIILINDCLSKNGVDRFFNLPKGTYSIQKHRVVYSLIKKEAYPLDTYINLPVKQKRGFDDANQFDCNIEYLKVREYAF